MTTTFDFDASISSAVAMADGQARPDGQLTEVAGPLDAQALQRTLRYWDAANYLTVAQIYLLENPLLREPLRQEHIKPRLLGHWGTSPGLSLIYIHLNRLINERDANVIYLTGPGHGGPALVAHAYLEGTYSEIYPEVSQDLQGVRNLCRRFSTPGGIPSHVSVQTPGSIHEGGELGYVLSHAFGAAFDNPDLIVAAVVGDGEAESGPLAGAWKSTSFLNPVRDGAVLPVLHLNGYKISGPTVLGRDSDDDIRDLLQGNGYEVHFVEGDDPARVHQQFAACAASTSRGQLDALPDGRVEPDEPLPPCGRGHSTRPAPERSRGGPLITELEARIEQSVAYSHEHLEDEPEVRDWVWTQ